MKTSDASASRSSANRFRNSCPGVRGSAPAGFDLSEFGTRPDRGRVILTKFAGLQALPPPQSSLSLIRGAI